MEALENLAIEVLSYKLLQTKFIYITAGESLSH